MSDKQALIYISDNCANCNALMKQLDVWDIAYETKNVSKDIDHMRELQEKGIYGTPATFVDNDNKAILGLQLNKLRQAFGMEHFHSYYEGWK